MNKSIILIAFILTFWISIQGQKIVFLSSFDSVQNCDLTSASMDLGFDEWLLDSNKIDRFFIHTDIPSKCAKRNEFKTWEGSGILGLNFKVTSQAVNDNWITSPLPSVLEPGKSYEIKAKVHKGKFSAAAIKEIGVLFTFVAPKLGVKYGVFEWEQRLVRLPVKSIQLSDSWVEVEMEYIASGLERYVSIGSFKQKFNLKDAAYLKNLWLDEAPVQLPVNCSYYLDEFTISEMKPTLDYCSSIWSENHIEKYLGKGNYILNGGFESFVSGKIRGSVSSIPGQQVATNWSSLGKNMPFLIRTDSNQTNHGDNHPYMGNGAMNMMMLKTNEHHTYGVSIDTIRHTAEGYHTYRIYENANGNKTPKYYRTPTIICSALRDTLVFNQEYVFESLCLLVDYSAFGTKAMNVYLLDSLPLNSDILKEMDPSFSVDLNQVNANIGYQHISQMYKAKGGERFIVLSYKDIGYNSIEKNPNFRRKVLTKCGPEKTSSYGCYNEIITYQDSLFAEYMFDNMLLQKADQRELNSTIYDGKNNQLQLFYGAIDKRNKAIVSNFNLAKNLVFELTEMLVLNDGICAVDLTKNKDVYLEPVSFVNKKRILRKLNKPRPKKKNERYSIDSTNLLLTSFAPERYNNHIILISDGSIEWSTVETNLKEFVAKGGKITMLFSGEEEREEETRNQFMELGNCYFICANSESAWDELVRLFVSK